MFFVGFMDELETEVAETQVVMPVGGEAKRMGLKMPKALIKLGNTALIDRCVKMFVACGFKRFVFLMGKGDDKITAHIDENMGKWGDITVVKAYDYAKGIAKGKAMKQAIMDGKIDKKMRCIVAFPDDVFFDPQLPKKAVHDHIKAANELGTISGAVVVKGHRYPYGVANVDSRGVVKSFEEKPLIPLLTATGVYIFEPSAYKYFIDLIDLNKPGPIEFEDTVMPQLAKEGKAYAIQIPPDSWVAINTMKELEQAQKLVEEGKIPKE
jgi:NDP-sugar pyrophosphorylase family protein